MTQRTRKPKGLADLLHKMQEAVSDTPVPISEEEAAIMAEVRAEHDRPSRREIRAFAKRLARRPR